MSDEEFDEWTEERVLWRLEDLEASLKNLTARVDSLESAVLALNSLEGKIEERRNDPEFQARLSRIIVQNKEALDRLSDVANPRRSKL